jgi:hypothetical protein
MLKKIALVVATAASLGASAMVVSTPAEAGWWYNGVYVERDRDWNDHEWYGRHHCHIEVRRVQVWDHGFPHWVRREFRICRD